MDWKKKEYWIVFCLIAATAFYSHLLRFQQIEPNRTVDFKKIPLEVGDWVGEDFFFDENVLDVLKADNMVSRRYVDSRGREVWLFIGYWKSQKYGAQPHSPLHCLPGSGWNIASNKLIRLHLSGNGNSSNSANEVNFATISNGKEDEGMLFWYQTRSGYLPKELYVKFDLARNALMRNPTDAAFIRINGPIFERNEALTLDTFRNFWALIGPKVEKALPF
jgi:EpsI family protein